ncbi:MAG: PQQ-binding-like beta-propeller repeat protein [Thermoplasmata archaeon]|nr:PQQ-binding-like beta-propeller repeat protein [Thermoplasmata archaeon]
MRVLRIAAICAISLLVLPPAVIADEWHSFQRDLANSGLAESDGPLSDFVSWKAVTGFGSGVQMTYANGVLFRAASHRGVQAINASNGNELWITPVNSGRVDTVPAYYKEKLYFGTHQDSGTVYALNASDGEVVWTVDYGWEYTASPLVVDGVVYIPFTSDRMVALHASNGTAIWDRNVPTHMHTSPAYENGVVYTAHKRVAAVNATNGDIIWQSDLQNYYFTSGIVVAGDKVCCNGHQYLACFHKTNGTTIWKRDLGVVRWNARDSTPAVMGDELFVGTQDGWAYSLYLNNGDILWNVTLGSPTNGSIIASPVIAPNGIVYFTNEDLYALNTSTGNVIWEMDLAGVSMRATPTLVNEVLYVNLPGWVLAVGDVAPPDVNEVRLDGQPTARVKPGTVVNITATVDDTEKGGHDVASANMSILPGTVWDMNPVDGSFDSPSERVSLLVDTAGMPYGEYALAFGVCDSKDNCGTVETDDLLIVDGTPPEVVPDALDSTPVLVPFHLEGSVTDEGEVVEVEIVYREPHGTQWNTGTASLDGGRYTFQVTSQTSLGVFEYHVLASDSAGNVARFPLSSEIEVRIVDESPPEILDLRADPETLLEGDTTAITWTIVEQFGLQSVEFEILDEDNHLVSEGSKEGPGPYETLFTPGSPGNYTVRVTVTDASDNSAQEEILISVDERPSDQRSIDWLFPLSIVFLLVVVSVLVILWLRRRRGSAGASDEPPEPT